MCLLVCRNDSAHSLTQEEFHGSRLFVWVAELRKYPAEREPSVVVVVVKLDRN